MEKQEYREEFNTLKRNLAGIKEEYDKKFRILTKEYLKSNKKYNIGDIVEGYSCRIKIDAICYLPYESEFIHDTERYCKYSGFKLRKSDNKVYKNKERGYINGNAIIKLIKKGE